MPNKKTIFGALISAMCSFALSSAVTAQQGEAPLENTLGLPYGSNISMNCSSLVLEAATEFAEENGWNVSIAVADTAGQQTAFLRMDNSHRASTDFALAKASSAALTKRSTKFFSDALDSGRNAILGFVDLHVHVAEGGEVLVQNGEIIGAIGAAGVTQKQDRQTALAGVNALARC